MRDRSPQSIWETALGQLELQVTRPNFETWLRNTTGLEHHESTFVVGVPTDFAVEWLRSRMAGQISRTVSQLLGSEVNADFRVLGAPVLTPPSTNGHGPSPSARLQRPALNARLTFDAFVVVKSNRMAYRAARRTGSEPARYNPLVIVGPSGLGKTHLLHAIGTEAVAAGRPVLAFTGESFVDRYGKSVRSGTPHLFRELFDGCGLLLFDNLSFLYSRPGSLDLFERVLDALLSRQCQVVVTAPQAPAESPALPATLHSRLGAGLTVELHAPPEDERLQILKAKSAALPRPLPARLLQAIARQPYTSIHELEGALNRVEAFADLGGGPISDEDLLRALYPLEQASPPAVSSDEVVAAVSSYFDIPPTHIAGPSRARSVTYARHVAMYLMRQHGSLPLAHIGQSLGGRDHTTVLSGVDRIRREIRSLPETRSDVEALEQNLNRSSVA